MEIVIRNYPPLPSVDRLGNCLVHVVLRDRINFGRQEFVAQQIHAEALELTSAAGLLVAEDSRRGVVKILQLDPFRNVHKCAEPARIAFRRLERPGRAGSLSALVRDSWRWSRRYL